MSTARTIAYLVALFGFIGEAHSTDISERQATAFCSFVASIDEVAARADEAIVEQFRIDRDQLAYIIVYITSKGSAGRNTERFFKCILEKLPNVEVSSAIRFQDEQPLMLKALAEDASARFAPESKISFSPIAVRQIGRTQTLGTLVAKAIERLQRATGYKFEPLSNEAVFSH